VTNDGSSLPRRAAQLLTVVLGGGSPLVIGVLVAVAGPGPSSLHPADPAQSSLTTPGTPPRTMAGKDFRSARLAVRYSSPVLDEGSSSPASEASAALTWQGPRPVVHTSKGYPHPATARFG
jgi:hypothetical protein